MKLLKKAYKNQLKIYNTSNDVLYDPVMIALQNSDYLTKPWRLIDKENNHIGYRYGITEKGKAVVEKNQADKLRFWIPNIWDIAAVIVAAMAIFL